VSLEVFINTCAYCNKRILASKNLFCLECNGLLPRTYFNFSESNIVLDKLKPLISLKAAGAFLFYNQNQMVQQILWEMKYNNNQEVAKEMGRLAFGGNENSFSTSIDFLIPIPLHKSKLRLRGYNQTECFAEGLSEYSSIPVLKDVLMRSKKTTSQTKLDRNERFQNLNEAFDIENEGKIKGKHILLVDDVVTTGATLISAGQALLNAGCASLGIYTLATAFEM
jgi:ComF family protein